MSVCLLVGQPSDFEIVDFSVSLCVFSRSFVQQMICSLVCFATWARWCVGNFKTVQICIYVTMSRDRGCEVVGGRCFHFQSFGNYRKVVFCDFTLGRSVAVSLPLVYTSVFEFTFHYTFGDPVVAFCDVQVRCCSLC